MKKLKKNIVDDISFGAIVKIRDDLLSMQRQGKKVYRMESGDPSFDVPDHVKNAIIDALKNNRTHYTDSTGIPELREAIAQKLQKKNGINATKDEVLVTNGGMNSLYVTFRALLSKNERVIIPDPMWTEIGENIKLSLGIPLPVDVFRYVDNIEGMNLKNVRAIFINSPHNPTGRVFLENEIRKIVNIASENGIFIVSDEAYEDVIFDNLKHFSPGSIYENTISLYSMSKSYAMSGLRIGYAHVKNEILKERMKKLLRCTINGVNSITQYGALAALQGPQDYVSMMRDEYQKRRDILYGYLKNSRYLDPNLPQGAFYMWNKIKEYPEGVKDSWEMSEFILKKTGVGSTPGPVFGPGGENHIRFAFSIETEKVREAGELLSTL